MALLRAEARQKPPPPSPSHPPPPFWGTMRDSFAQSSGVGRGSESLQETNGSASFQPSARAIHKPSPPREGQAPNLGLKAFNRQDISESGIFSSLSWEFPSLGGGEVVS